MLTSLVHSKFFGMDLCILLDVAMSRKVDTSHYRTFLIKTHNIWCTYTQQDIATSWAKYARICVNCSTSWWVRTTRVVTRICAHSSYTGHLCIQQMNLSNSKLLCLWPCNISYMFDNQEYHQLEDNSSISFWICGRLHSSITKTVEFF